MSYGYIYLVLMQNLYLIILLDVHTVYQVLIIKVAVHGRIRKQERVAVESTFKESWQQDMFFGQSPTVFQTVRLLRC